jgi:signal transduction histidine kinase/DNA-binding response OmpR family regulator
MNRKDNNIRRLSFYNIVLCLIWTSSVFGQFKYETLSTAQGLSQGYIWNMIQDRDGFLWMTTKAGLNRYDGYNFKVYNHNAYDTTSISSNDVGYLLEDSKGRIWVTTKNEFNIFDKKRDRFVRLIYPRKQPHSSTSVTWYNQIIELSDGRFLLHAADNYFDLITVGDDIFDNPKSVTVSYIPKPGYFFSESIFKGPDQNIYFGLKDVLYKLDLNKQIFEPVLGEKAIDIGYISHSGKMWTRDQLLSYIDKDNKLYPTFNKSPLDGQIANILVEDNGRMWLCIPDKNNLKIYNTQNWSKENPINPDATLIFEDKKTAGNALLLDRTGLVWMGLNGHGLRKYSFDSDKFKHQAHGLSIKKISRNHMGDLFLISWSEKKIITQDGKFIDWEISNFKEYFDYYITENGMLWRTQRVPGKNKIIAIEKVNLITNQKETIPVQFDGNYDHEHHFLQDRNGYLWIGGVNGDIAVFDTKSGKYKEFQIPFEDNSNSIISTAIYQDHAGTTWIGTILGFAKIETPNIFTTNPKITLFKNNPKNKNSINNNHVLTFIDDPSNHHLLWIGTKGGGLNLFNKKTGIFTHITTSQGLCNDVVYGLLDDDNGNIWGSTNNGLFCLLQNKERKDNFEFRHFTEAAGLQAAEFNTDAYLKFANGDLAFGGINGINIFNPKEILVDTFTPNIFITKLLVGNKVVKVGDEHEILKTAIEYTPSIMLNHKQDVFTLEFSSLDFRAPDQNKYRYQLEGIDDVWTESGARRSVTYSHLPAGTYIFKVQGSNTLGIWNDKIAQLTIHILPPWWATWWAYLIYLCLIGYALRWYYLHKLNKNKVEAQLIYEQKESNRIKELDKIKTHLYTNITHEFRTPLTVILGMVQHIRKSANDHLDSGLDMIERNGNNLLRLVNEMLDLSKLEAGKMELNLSQGDVINFIRYIVESFHSVAESQDKKMHYLSSLDNMYVKYDEEKIRQIISNLLSNALKFTSKKGDIYISISTDNQNELCIKVKDTGKGIPESQQHHIFDRFYQVDTTHTRNAEGTGIGLALTKELVQLMDGEISVKSPPIGAKVGTEFTVTLPLEIVNDYIEGPDKQSKLDVVSLPMDKNSEKNQISIQNTTHADKELILLVEDNADVVAYTASCLQEYRLAVGRDGQEGFDIACDLVPDLIITDVMMPLMDGYEMTKRLREDMRTSHIPIIMLTAKADIESKLEGIEYGAEVYLEKPFNVDELTLRVRKLLQQRATLQKAYATQMGLQLQSKDSLGIENDQTQNDLIVIPKIENEFVNRVASEIEKHLSDESFSVEQLAKNLFMSYSQVQRKLNAVIGMSPNQYIKFLRLEKSKQLLNTTDETIMNISMTCGFSDPSYFGKVFKQEYGVTPQEWRQK